MEKIDKLKESLKPILEECGVKLYELNYHGGRDATLQIVCCKTNGEMDLDTCEIVSRKVSDYLDESDPIESAYTLEVCSPGAEREIQDLSELNEQSNAYVYLQCKEPVNKMMEFTGTVTGYTGDTISLEYMVKAVKKTVTIETNNIHYIRHAVKI